MMSLRDCSSEERPAMGKLINELKEEVTNLCKQTIEALEQAETARRIEAEKIDVTLPGRKRFSGRKHPLALLRDEVIQILAEMGFSVQYGPDIDSDYYNYEGLNFPPDHPAREIQDTFYMYKSRSSLTLAYIQYTASCYGKS